MSCCIDLTGATVSTDGCTMVIKDSDGNIIKMMNLATMDVSVIGDTTYYLDGVTGWQVDNATAVSLGIDADTLLPLIQECKDGDMLAVDQVSISEVLYCRVADKTKVYLRTCKDEDGVLVTTDLDSGAVIPQSDIFTLYAIDCEEEAKIVDLEEVIVVIPVGGGEENVSPLIGYDALSIFNCSDCPMLATIELTDENGNTTLNNVLLLPNQTRTFDWSCDAITDFVIGEVGMPTGTINADDLTTQSATKELKSIVTFFNS